MSARFQCLLCLGTFATKQRLDYHIEHNVCQKHRSFQCLKCEKQFASAQTLNYHVEHKVCQKKPIKPKPKLVLRQHTSQSTSEIELLKLEVALLIRENRTLKNHLQTIQ